MKLQQGWGHHALLGARGKDVHPRSACSSASPTHLLGDIFSGGQLLADGSEGGLVHLPHASVQHLNGLVALPLSWSFVPA